METLLATIMLKLLEFELAKAQANAEGRSLTAEEIDHFRQGHLESEEQLKHEIEVAKAEGR